MNQSDYDTNATLAATGCIGCVSFLWWPTIIVLTCWCIKHFILK